LDSLASKRQLIAKVRSGLRPPKDKRTGILKLWTSLAH
jgi:hypothetical protein